ncbi:UDP-glucose/GDP-mannose dehydrogenase family protein [Kocuria palustris]|jgi:UDPglucose 6-dehydrogenase|uniref:UDP-glucose dehydrogenase family protein n=1 Tax=Kocuria palustris TaxID=71999 RepID=UPI0019CFB815|nr:UDP-glucose/GDP-mannose dehydrogenase family protein [Kocuria palustris]MBN6752233.1 UDP-glucose/GDP-mannose dehydrogenase family protein [Kocuria palustris]MBN6757188.1 UDP-glucose/GDP-mannose dehydrogenase family protein [Kocuria palustris]MBN6762216.1 UDP-glucose/GDP-mannose dehydrogenase family protein [Kocuria palustris]MBN6781698.1 UDP-glucose/GDP-mannose dehydrogenase family protein [Kocuria palustris]MBN6798182.1 UDP-glucose/GDP-mannose dehydrogenase family protein [Kocuria palustri
MRITVLGTGYLGATHAASLAEMGYEVLGVDIDPAKLESLSAGVLPFHEPELPQLLRKHVESGRLRFTSDYEEAGAFGDVHFIGVGTPQRPGAFAADMSFVDSAVEQISRHLTRDAVIAGKSTVPVGTARRLRELARENAPEGIEVDLVWNPEFLREGHSVEDTLHPDRMVIGLPGHGSADPQEREQAQRLESLMREVYAPQLAEGIPLIVTDYETSELVKVAANSFLATKISFINSLSELTEAVGGDIRTLADAIGMDERIGRKFLNAGVGFGGGCLPKDIRALRARASELGLDQSVRFLAEVDDINTRRREHTVGVITDMLDGSVMGREIAVLGAAFKPESDDVRDSPALDIAARLHSIGADVHVYDPKANENAAKRYPRVDYASSLIQAVARAEVVVLLTEWDEFRRMTPQDLAPLVRRRQILDGRNVLDPQQWIDADWTYRALGRRG